MGKIVLDREKCKACYLCIDVCPKKSIRISEELNNRGVYPAYFDESQGCIGCTMCAYRCPDLAIEKVYK